MRCERRRFISNSVNDFRRFFSHFLSYLCQRVSNKTNINSLMYCFYSDCWYQLLRANSIGITPRTQVFALKQTYPRHKKATYPTLFRSFLIVLIFSYEWLTEVTACIFKFTQVLRNSHGITSYIQKIPLSRFLHCCYGFECGTLLIPKFPKTK